MLRHSIVGGEAITTAGRKEPATAVGRKATETEVGSVFVSNYPPYSFWKQGEIPAVHRALDAAPAPDADLGVYLHIPFCRRRCKFCYFRVYTDKNSKDVERYLDALIREARAQSQKPALVGRTPKFVYFGGGTPSFISARHLRGLVERLQDTIPWDDAEEVTFECEPGTLTRAKLEAIREVGVTRLSLGVENFNDAILEENGRAHVSREIHKVLPWIKSLDFDQLNIDLIAGMIGESEETWKDSVAKTLDADPDSVTIYQMELPFNTVYSRRMLDGGELPVADWRTKRDWHRYALETLEAAGYEVSSAYTMVKSRERCRFVYRDSVWRGCDVLGLGVSSFSHLNGLHYQNLSNWDAYLSRVESDELPVERGFAPSHDERLTREMILQLKLGCVGSEYFERKYGERILDRFKPALERLQQDRMLEVRENEIRLTRKGLLRVDQLLPEFYAPEYQNARYT